MLGVAGARATGSAGSARPDIWFILSDDQGYNSIGFHNKDLITPNVNELVQNGRELTRQYVYKFCSPTRTSFVSGRLPIHVNQENSATEQPLAGIPVGMTTIAERLNATGYSCHQVGKWHCGQASKKHIPSGRGFNTSLGFFNFGEDHYTQIRGGQAEAQWLEDFTVKARGGANCQGVDLWKTDAPAYGYNGSYAGYMYTEEAIRVIKERDAAKPLFMFTAFQNIHPPLQVPSAYMQRYKTPEMQTDVNGMITFLDESIGNITKVVKSEGMWDNMLIVFSADNGGYLGNGGDDTPRRGGKFGDFEGGTRVNSFISGGFVPAAVRGTPVDGMVHIADWYATFLHLAGNDNMHDARAAAANLPQPDSINVWNLISTANKTSPRTETVLSALTGMAATRELSIDEFNSDQRQGGYRDPMYFTGGEAIIQGDYKLILGGVWKGPFSKAVTNPCTAMVPPWNKTNPGVPCTCGTGGCLFNVVTDPNEEEDLVAKMPDLVTKLKTRLAEVRQTVYAPDRGDIDQKACDQIQINRGFWGPWMDEH